MNNRFRLTGLALALSTSLSAIALEQPQQSSSVSTACQPPATAPEADASQQDFDRYSWNVFVALNWPAQTGQRGQPDCSQPLGSSGPSVWQSYKTLDEIFLPNGQNPGPWNSPLETRSLSQINIAALKNTSVVGAIDQAVGGWLIDQRGNPTYYDIAANQTSYDYIVENNFYNADIVSKAKDINFPNQATEIKTAWRILTAQDDASRYLTMQAQVAQFDTQGQPTGNTTEATLGLVGMHIIVKAPGYPQWIWSTFEQVDNVPPKVKNSDGTWSNQPQVGINYSYFDANAPANSLNQSPCTWQQQGKNLICTPKAGTSFQTPNPLDRTTPIITATAEVNAQYQQDLQNTLLKYYQLITTQRPKYPDNPSNPLGQPTPAISANVTMESYIQPNSSCMQCHSMAQAVNSVYRSDYSYLFKFAKSPSTLKDNKDEQ